MRYDAVVIGGGPGGYVCAIRLAQLGKKVALVEKHKLGGECLNYGCIPSKALIFASSLYDKIQHASDFGIEVENVHLNIDKLHSFRTALITKLNTGIGFLLKHNKVDVISGQAQFISPQKISVNGSQDVEADSFVVSTGSEPIQIPGFEYDGNFIMGSKEALELSPLPKNLLVLGGGVIGLELGTYFSKLGSKVSIVEMMDQLLPGVDKELVSVVERALKKRGVEIYTSTKAKKIEKSNGVSLKIEAPDGEKVLTADKLLVTIGRKASVGTLGLDKAQVKVSEKGFIVVDENLKTSNSHIYAIGDVTGQPLLAHKASHDGISVAEYIVKNKNRKKSPMSWAIFTDPEIAGVGLSQDEAQKGGKNVIVGKFPFMALGRALAVSEPEGFVKVIADRDTQEVLGVFMVGAHTSDLISESALAVTHHLRLEDIADTIHPHPTLPEGFMEAAQVALGKAIHIPNR